MRQLVITTRVTNRESDSFQQYLKEVAQIELFTPEEEIECSIKASQGDEIARNELVRRNLRFVISVAKQYSIQSMSPIEDLVNEGNIGLIKASMKFKPEMKHKFISYAVWWIRKVILVHLANDGRMVRIPSNKLNNLSKLDAKINEMEQRNGRSIDIQEILAEMDNELNSDELELLEVIKTYHMDSTDREVGGVDGSSSTIGELLTSDTFKPTDHLIVDANMKSEIGRILDSLKPRNQRIITALYGLDGKPPLTLEEVGIELGVTRESIRQTREKILKGLREKLKDSTIQNY